jgi:hydroxymethylpyrimidine kinase / phosphomethylpyrimidine kinase / thiamine-phosphate diphosphorylase
MNTRGRLQFITDPRPGFGPGEQIEMACGYGIDWVQLRMKNVDKCEKKRIGELSAKTARKGGALFIVNDDVELALELGADGIHLGLDDEDPTVARKILGDGAIIGGTCNDIADIRLRKRQGVDYIGLGPYRFTSTKKKLSPLLGLQGIEQLMRQCREEKIAIPVVAIGGIRVQDLEPLMKTGIHGIALSSLIIDADDMATRIREIQEKLQ